MLIATGPGIRARHVFGSALDLGLPTGALAALASTEAEQNGHIIAALLAEDGVSYLPHTSVARQLAGHLTATRAVVSNGYPPYEMSEFPPPVGKIPPHQTDTGAFLIADAYGAARTGLRQGRRWHLQRRSGDCRGRRRRADPPRQRDGADRDGARDLPIDRLLLDLMANAKHVKEIQIVNGLTPGNITKALAGEHVGTIVHAG